MLYLDKGGQGKGGDWSAAACVETTRVGALQIRFHVLLAGVKFGVGAVLECSERMDSVRGVPMMRPESGGVWCPQSVAVGCIGDFAGAKVLLLNSPPSAFPTIKMLLPYQRDFPSSAPFRIQPFHPSSSCSRGSLSLLNGTLSHGAGCPRCWNPGWVRVHSPFRSYPSNFLH
ncbi:unnamed protein product [Trypanosoma congolense IL3000]|uniref:WGS project CAEQ00000000 data, annotated contig 1946 n=1 Tax=Trypanosoma congolense (strain IL3000) TaxID=1068625 RepID=F9WA80_TRYCI|nr:unnamed protein product [Trypanosoma congolense IL3000]